jgi:hypothetical protein
MGPLLMIGAAAAQVTAAPETPPAATESTAPAVRHGQSTYLDLEGGVGYSTNPELGFGSNLGSAFGRLSIHGVHTRVSERTTTVLSGFAQNSFYTNHLGSRLSVDLSARHDVRVNEKLSIFGDVDLAYDQNGQLDTRINSIPDVPLPPGVLLPPQGLPNGGDFLSVTGKQYRASAHIGAQMSLSARDSLSVSTGADHVISKNGLIDTNYTSIPVSLGWNRQLDPRTTVGVSVNAITTDYEGPARVRTITPQLTMTKQLSQRLTVSGAIGVAFSSITDAVATRHTKGLSGDIDVCWRGESDNFCGRFSVDQTTATALGPAKSMNLSVDYSKRLGPDDTLQLSASLNRYSNPVSFVSGQTFSRSTYARLAADYSRKIGNRLFAGADLTARKLVLAGPDPKADVTGTLFVRYRLGDIR